MGGKQTKAVAPTPTMEQQFAKIEKMREERRIETEEALRKLERDRRRAEEAPARKKREEKKIADANIGINMRNADKPITLVRPHKGAVKKVKVAPAGLDIYK